MDDVMWNFEIQVIKRIIYLMKINLKYLLGILYREITDNKWCVFYSAVELGFAKFLVFEHAF